MSEAVATNREVADYQRQLRAALGQFATGVTVVTCNSDRGPTGITVNSFSSVSLNPPLVLWSVSRLSDRYDSFMHAERFAIHVLTARQEYLCHAFAKDAQAFEGVGWHYSDQGVPLIDHCLACYQCSRYASYAGGDHTIVVGKVTGFTTNIGKPLIFSQSRIIAQP